MQPKQKQVSLAIQPTTPPPVKPNKSTTAPPSSPHPSIVPTNSTNADSILATRQFQNCAASGRNRVLGLLLAGEAARKDATTSCTQEQCASNFIRWQKFLSQIGIFNDDFLSTFDEPWHRTLLLSAFAQAMREASFSSAAYTSLAETTVRASVDNVAQTFRANNRPDPRTDDDGKLAFILQQQFKGYKNKDKNVKQQKALPLCVIRQLHRIKSSNENIAIAQLCTAAIFFCHAVL